MNLGNLFEGAIDELEKRRIEDLEAKMDDLAHRAKESKDSKVIAALRHEFAKCKAERDSYHYVQEWEDTAPGHDRNQTSLEPVEETWNYATPWGKEAAIKQKATISRPASTSNDEVKTFAAQGYTIKFKPDVVEIYHGADLVYSKPGNFANPTRAQLGAIRGRVTDLASRAKKEVKEAGSPAQQAAIAIAKKKQQKVDEHGGGGAGPREWHNYVKAHRTDEGWQDFNKVEPYAVCLAGKPIKKFDYYEEARRFHDNWKQKLYREGNKEKADKITLMPLNFDESSMSDAEHHHTGPEFTGYWKGTDSATPGNKMVGGGCEESKEFKVPAARNFVAKNMKSAGAGQHKDAKRAMKQGDVKHKGQRIPADEGAKVDRMQQHIAKSEKDLGHSKKDAEAIGWATLNKRGYLDNANKKKHNESVNFMEWAVAQGSRFNNFAGNPEVYAQAKAAYIAEGFGTALANVSSKISGHPRKMKSAQQIRNKAMKFKPQPIAETDVEEDYVSEIKKGQKDSNGNTSCWTGYHAAGTKPGKNGPVRNCVPNESLEEVNGEYDDEAGMAQGNLYTIAKAAEGLLDTIGPRDNLPEWAQEKIAKVEGMLVTVWNYLQSQKAHGIDPQITETEAWQKANKKDKTDGMSRKAVKAYRREHPGSKLKTAVTTKPSKLKKGSKASKRRSSYCSRSKGQMDMHNISCAKTPDKAICKARRRWNCEGVENLDAMLAEAIEKGTLQPGQYYIWTVYFDDGSSKKIKVTKDNFDPKAYYAKKNQVVINVDYDWEPHNG